MKKHYRGSIRSDPVTVINPVTYHPHNIVPGTEQVYFFFVVKGDFQIGQKITDLFKSRHSQRYKLISGFPFSYSQRINQHVTIQSSRLGIIRNNKSGSAFHLLYG